MSAIVPLDKITTLTIYSFTLDRIEVDLFNSARIRVNLMDQNNNRIDCTFVTLSGDDYTNWGNNDDYIISYVANKLGFTVQNVTLPAVEETPPVVEETTPAVEETPPVVEETPPVVEETPPVVSA